MRPLFIITRISVPPRSTATFWKALQPRFSIPEKNGGKIMVGKIIKTPHDFAPHDFAKSLILTRGKSTSTSPMVRADNQTAQ
jgi:hypothetical protein